MIDSWTKAKLDLQFGFNIKGGFKPEIIWLKPMHRERERDKHT